MPPESGRSCTLATDKKQPDLRRELGEWSAAAIVIGTVIGSGIFLVPSVMIREVGSPFMVFAVWIFGGVLSLFGALSLCELPPPCPKRVVNTSIYAQRTDRCRDSRMDPNVGRKKRVDCRSRDGFLLLHGEFPSRTRRV